VAVGGDPDLFAAAHQLANHPRAGEGLACTRRSLNRQNATGEVRAEPNRGVNGRLVRAMQRLASDARTLPEQEIARRLVRPVNTYNLTNDISTALHRSWFAPDDIKVAADGGKVTLTGHVKSWSERELAGSTAWGAPGATDVENYLIIA
jgi:hypothetical protein